MTLPAGGGVSSYCNNSISGLTDDEAIFAFTAPFDGQFCFEMDQQFFTPGDYFLGLLLNCDEDECISSTQTFYDPICSVMCSGQIFYLVYDSSSPGSINGLNVTGEIIGGVTCIDPCQDSQYLSCGETITGSNQNAGNNILTNQCNNSFQWAGNDIVYQFEHYSGSVNWITLWNDNNVDLDLFVFDSCPYSNPNATCLGWSYTSTDVCANLNFESIKIDESVSTGLYYILVDAQFLSSQSSFELSLSCEGIECDDLPLECGLNSGFTTNTFGNINLASNYPGCYDNQGCISPSESSNGNGFQGSFTGPENIHEFVAPETGNYSFIMNPEGSLDLELFLLEECCETTSGGPGVFVITDVPDCYDSSNCLQGSTNGPGQSEFILNFFIDKGVSVFLVVDGFLGDKGGYSIEVVCGQQNCDDDWPRVECNETYNGSISSTDVNNFTKSNTYESECAQTGSNPFTGPDDVILVDLGNDSKNATICLSGLNGDLDIFLFRTCNGDGSLSGCIGGVSGALNSGSTPEQIEVTNGSGEYFLVVEQGATGVLSPYTIEVKCDPDCNDAWEVFCNDDGSSEYFHTTNQSISASDQYQPSQSYDTHFDCTGWDDGCDSTNDNPTNNYNEYEVIYSLSTFGLDGQDVVIDLVQNGSSADLDLFVYDECDFSGNLDDCVASSTYSYNPNIGLIGESIIIENAPFNTTYYIVVDAKFGDSFFEFSVTCGDICDESVPIECGIPLTEKDTRLAGNDGSHYCDCTDVNGDDRPDGYNWGPDAVYDFALDSETSIALSLEILDNNRDLNLYLLEEVSPGNKECRYSSRRIGDDDEAITATLHAGKYFVVVEGYRGDDAEYTLLLECGNFCNDIIYNPTLTKDNYVVFDNPLDLNIQYFEVAYPLDTLYTNDQAYELLETTDFSGGTLDYYCPQPGCYYICFWYLNDDGNLDSCCIKYCAEFPDYNCPNYPVVNNYVDLGENAFSCYFTCGLPVFDPTDNQVVVQSDSSYIELTYSDGSTYGPYEEGEVISSLPYGEYQVCCWIYDPICDYWDICCKTYCFPYIESLSLCSNSDFNNTLQATSNPLVYTFDSQNFYWFDVVPSVDFEEISPQIYAITFPSEGVYKVEYTADNMPWCSEYICIDGTPQPDICFDIEYISEAEIGLSCNLDDFVNGWNIYALCSDDPNVDCEAWVYEGQNIGWTIPYPGEFEICKDYNGCCGELSRCCETICYNPFNPYPDEDENFEECDGITLNGWTFGKSGEIYGDFSYEGDLSTGVAWEIYVADTGGGFSRDKSGSNGMNFITDEEDYEFYPGESYFICYTYLDENNCNQYCCIKVEVSQPEECDGFILPTFTGNEESLDFTFEYDGLAPNEEVVQWYIGGDDSFNLSSSTTLEYVFPDPDMYNIYILIYNNSTQCYRLCCFTFCCENPLGCDDIIIENYDPFTGSYHLALTNHPGANILNWQIDLPQEYAQPIDDPTNFIPSEYGIPANTKIWVSVKFRDASGCLNVCCIMLCSTGGGTECREECYDDCCANSDKSWLEDVKATALINCNTSICLNNTISQADFNGQCVYVVGVCQDLPALVYSCNGEELFFFGNQNGDNEDLAQLLTNFEIIWSCSGGDIPPCDAFDCDMPNPLSCETFESYMVDTSIEDRDNWSNTSNGSLFIEEEVSNNFLAIQRHNGDDANATYNLSVDNAQGSLLRLSYDLWIPSGHGIQTIVNNAININLQTTDNGDPGINVSAGNFQTEDSMMNPYIEWDYNFEEWVTIELTLNTLNTDLEIRINDIRVTYIPNSGVFRFDTFFVDTALISDNTAKGQLDNICLNSCGELDRCYEDCCDGEDNAWLIDIIETGILINMECNNNTSNTIISQCQTGSSCYYVVQYIPCFDGTPLPTIFEFYACDGTGIPAPNVMSSTICKTVWDYHVGYVPLCDQDGPCPYPGNEECEEFEQFEFDDAVTNYNEWEALGNTNPYRVAEENGNQYIQVDHFGFTNSGFTYTLPTVNGTKKSLSMRLRMSDTAITNFTFGGSNGSQIMFNSSGSGRFITLLLDNFITSSLYPYPSNQWYDIGFVYDESTDEFWLSVNDLVIAYEPNSGFSGFTTLEVESSTIAGSDTCLDDICMSSCPPCPADTEPDFDCNLISITNILNQDNGAPAVTFESTASDILRWEIIEEDTGESTVIPTSSSIYTNGNLEAGVTYFICMYYIDDEGCERICCIKLTVPQSCNQHLLSATDSEFDYSITNQGLEDNSLLQSTWIDGSDLGDEEEIIYEFSGYGEHYICCLYYDTISRCYTLCCTPLCLEEPQSCDDLFTVDYNGDMDNPLQYEIGFSATVGNDWTWSIDGGFFGGSDMNTANIDFASLGYPTYAKVEVCVKYYDFSIGCYETCCISIQLSEPYAGCSLIELGGDFESGFTFTSSQFLNAQWYIVGLGFNGFGMGNLDPNDSVIQNLASDDGLVYVCMLYFNGDCYQTCCIPVCIIESSASCSLLDISWEAEGSDFIFTLEENGMERVSCTVMLPDGSTQNLGDDSTYISSIEGDYLFICEYVDGCGGTLVCNQLFCVTADIDCPVFMIDVDPLTNIVTFIHDIVGGQVYTWNFGDGTTSNDPSQTITHQYPDDGVYTAVLEVRDACGTACVQSVTIDPTLLVVTPTLINPTCQNNNDGSISIEIIGGQEPYSITWSTGDTDAIEISGLAAGLYSVSVVDDDGQEVSASFDLIAPILIEYTVSTVHTTCGLENGQVIVEVTNDVSLDSATLDGGDLGSDNSVSGLGAGDYQLIITDENGCIQEETITISPSQSASLSLGDDIQTCVGTTVELAYTSDDQFIDLVWTLDDVVIMMDTENISVSKPGTYILSTMTIEGCEAIDEINVSLFEIPDLIEDVAHTTCGEDNGSISLSSSNMVAIDQFEIPELGLTSSGNTISDLPSGTYTVMITDGNTCSSEVTITIDSSTQLSIELGDDITLCPNELFSLQDLVTIDITNPQWILDEFVLTEADASNVSESGTYTLLGLTSNGCLVTDDIIITFLDPLIMQGEDTLSVSAGELVTLPITSALTATWTSDDYELTCIDCVETSFTALVSGTINVNATDDNGCNYTFIYVIEVEPGVGNTGPLSGPNMFTPNNDTANDFLVFEGLEDYEMNTLVVFNRWGRIVYETESYSNNWDAIFNGDPLPDGVYYYVLEYGNNSTSEFTISRDLLLIRDR